MNKLLLLFSLFTFNFSLFTCFAQNLVPNPSFEEHSLCPDGLGQITYCQDWVSFRGTPDYYNTCSTMNGMAPPNTPLGYQYPRTGNAFTGFAVYAWNNPNMQEHVGVHLFAPLNIGAKYYLTFYINTAYNASNANIATNKIGALLTTYQYSDPDWLKILPNACTIKEDSIINDTVNWVKISGSFIADSAYQYLVIGCFFDDNHIDTLNLPYPLFPQLGYYNLDDICLSTDSIYCENWTGLNNIINNRSTAFIYPNPSSDEFHIISNDAIEFIQVLNSTGQVVYSSEKIKDKEFDISLGFLKAGIYIVRIETTSYLSNIKINIIH